MALRSWLSRLEKRAGHSSFVLSDGTIHRYDFDQACGELFSYCIRLWTEDAPASLEAPLILQAIRNARDPAEAMEPFRPQNRRGAGAFLDPIVLIQDHDEGDREA
jgi:hypothetical protein